jgi:hypothetical protein
MNSKRRIMWLEIILGVFVMSYELRHWVELFIDVGEGYVEPMSDEIRNSIYA